MAPGAGRPSTPSRGWIDHFFMVNRPPFAGPGTHVGVIPLFRKCHKCGHTQDLNQDRSTTWCLYVGIS